MSVLSDAVKGLRGTEFVFNFTKNNGKNLAGKVTKAYVAEADLKKGITIMGKLPEGVDPSDYGVEDINEDIVLRCLNCQGNDGDPEYLAFIDEYVKNIKKGIFNMESTNILCTSGRGNAGHMADSCAFR